jgi:hypothetical protein
MLLQKIGLQLYLQSAVVSTITTTTAAAAAAVFEHHAARLQGMPAAAKISYLRS